MLVGSHDAGAYRPYGGPGDDNLVTSATFAQVREYIFVTSTTFVQVREYILVTSATFAQVIEYITWSPVLHLNRS